VSAVPRRLSPARKGGPHWSYFYDFAVGQASL